MRYFLCCLIFLFLSFSNIILVNADENKTNNQIKKANSDAVDNKYIHIVQNGDNIYRISLKYKITQKELMEANNLTGSNVFVGQKLKLPKNAVFEDDNQTNTTANQSANSNQNQSVNNKIDEKNEKLNRVEITEKNKQTLNLVNKIEATTFIWPARGIILTKFGHQINSGRLEGINIGGETGSVVKAASSGEIIYNDKINGYGNVILIRHYNGFFTAYGHTDPLVAVGDKVKKGQVIAYMEKNKQSKRSILYFSIRKNGKSYDPEKLIQTKISS